MTLTSPKAETAYEGGLGTPPWKIGGTTPEKLQVQEERAGTFYILIFFFIKNQIEHFYKISNILSQAAHGFDIKLTNSL